jgi:hypothetical protein
MNISRRKIIQSAALTMALPALETFAGDKPDALLKRMLAFYVPNGMHMLDFYFEGSGQLKSLPFILEPLNTIKDKFTAIKGLINKPAYPDGPGDHASGTAAFLTVAHPKKTKGNDIFNGISIDQVIAKALRDQTPLASIQLGLEGGGSIGDCDSGYSCAYPRNISWASATQPLPKIVNPQLFFDQLFGGYDSRESTKLQALKKQKQKSVLDYVLAQTQDLNKKLSHKDKVKLEQYQTGVRELELKLAASDAQACANAQSLEMHNDAMADVNVHSELMSDLMVMAFECQYTNVISYMMGNGGSNRNYDFLGVPGAHHEISHHQGNQENFDKLKNQL